jgi:hypothetical protein
MKYAIYKTSYGGLRSADYVDNLKDCRDYLFGPCITEDRLPIIVNSMGGYTSFDPNDPNFVEIIECDEDAEPLTREQRYPKNSKLFEYGWIDTDGNTYACSHEGHWRSAKYICKDLGIDTYNAESKLEELNWLKVTLMYSRGSRSRKVLSGDGLYITKKQADTLVDLGLHKEDPMVEGFIKRSEIQW